MKDTPRKLLQLASPIVGDKEKLALSAVIDSGWLTMGERVKAFERAFAQLHGAEEAVAVNSCTAALHLSLLALDIGPGDEVLVPSLTFVATVNVILYVGAVPVFVDIEDITRPHIALEDARAKLTRNTRAAIVMHYGGYTVDLAAWRAFADDHGIALVEDAAHAPAMKGVGTSSDASAFSFFTNKNMTTAEGGMVLARETAALKQVRLMRSHGMTTNTIDRYRGHAHDYDVQCLGYNYRLDELRAAVGLVQLAHLHEWNLRRRALSDHYRRALTKHIPSVIVPFSGEDDTSGHLMPVLLPSKLNRSRAMDQLRSRGIQTSVHYPAAHRFSYYRSRYPEISLRKTEEFAARVLTLPLHPALTPDDIDTVVLALREIVYGI
jgi:dTDP-4-amino-4,6-dideoxygalactose transaminase